MKDAYSILGVSRNASEADIRAAYRRLAMQYHPDRNPGDAQAEERFKEVAAAYDDIRSGRSDDQVHPAQDHYRPDLHPHFANLDEMFRAFEAHHRRRNRDINVVATIPLETVLFGTDITVTVGGATRREVRVSVPPGVDNGTRLRVPQAGDDTFSSLAPGDLYVEIRIRPHPRFEREGRDLIFGHQLDVIDAMIGGSIRIAGLDGSQFDVTLPPMMQNGTRVRVAGKGLPGLRETQHGDLYIIPALRMPKSLSDAQIILLKQMKDLFDRPASAM
jgi:DnaJ-class molecular chaperone